MVIKTKETAFKSRLVTYEIVNTKNVKDIKQFLYRLETNVNRNIRKELANKVLRVNIVVFIEYKSC
jgi:hypothetical protein